MIFFFFRHQIYYCRSYSTNVCTPSNPFQTTQFIIVHEQVYFCNRRQVRTLCVIALHANTLLLMLRLMAYPGKITIYRLLYVNSRTHNRLGPSRESAHTYGNEARIWYRALLRIQKKAHCAVNSNAYVPH